MILIELLAFCIGAPVALIAIGGVWLWIGKNTVCWILGVG